MTNTSPARACPPIIYGLGLATPAQVIDALTGMLRRYQRRIGTRWRGYDTRLQAVLTCAWLEGGHTYQALADGNEIARETCRRYIMEGVKVLARRALPLTEVIRLAVLAGWPFLIVDGVNIPTERLADRKWFSGKHHRHSGSVQTVAGPDGELLWVSGVLPGRTADVRAARRYRIAEKVLQFLGLLADLGYVGLDPEVIVGWKRGRGQKALPVGKKAANRLIAGLRAVGERGNAQLKHWRVLAHDFRGDPRQLTGVVKAIQALQYMIRDPFGREVNTDLLQRTHCP
ncbi:MAG TPA: transposase family protein [Candidatus Limnocylindrales bacterium]|nr:transposase family protein [Candidatus Limnocylindrales bacterium]